MGRTSPRCCKDLKTDADVQSQPASPAPLYGQWLSRAEQWRSCGLRRFRGKDPARRASLLVGRAAGALCDGRDRDTRADGQVSRAFVSLLLLGACVAPGSPPSVPAPAPAASPVSAAVQPLIADIPLSGRLEQGGIGFGTVPSSYRLRLGGDEVPVAGDGRFIIGIDRDAPATLLLEAHAPDGRRFVKSLTIAPRA